MWWIKRIDELDVDELNKFYCTIVCYSFKSWNNPLQTSVFSSLKQWEFKLIQSILNNSIKITYSVDLWCVTASSFRWACQLIFIFLCYTTTTVVESRLVFLTYPNSNCLFVVMPLYSLFRPVFWKLIAVHMCCN